jgi:hypothetical protein
MKPPSEPMAPQDALRAHDLGDAMDRIFEKARRVREVVKGERK